MAAITKTSCVQIISNWNVKCSIKLSLYSAIFFLSTNKVAFDAVGSVQKFAFFVVRWKRRFNIPTKRYNSTCSVFHCRIRTVFFIANILFQFTSFKTICVKYYRNYFEMMNKKWKPVIKIHFFDHIDVVHAEVSSKCWAQWLEGNWPVNVLQNQKQRKQQKSNAIFFQWLKANL